MIKFNGLGRGKKIGKRERGGGGKRERERRISLCTHTRMIFKR